MIGNIHRYSKHNGQKVKGNAANTARGQQDVPQSETPARQEGSQDVAYYKWNAGLPISTKDIFSTQALPWQDDRSLAVPLGAAAKVARNQGEAIKYTHVEVHAELCIAYNAITSQYHAVATNPVHGKQKYGIHARDPQTGSSNEPDEFAELLA